MAHHDHGIGNESTEELESAHFKSIVQTFLQYETYSLSANNRRRKDFHRIPLAHQAMLEELGWRKRLDQVDERIALNAAFLRQVVDNPDIFAHYETGPLEDHIHQDEEQLPSRARPSLFHDPPGSTGTDSDLKNSSPTLPVGSGDIEIDDHPYAKLQRNHLAHSHSHDSPHNHPHNHGHGQGYGNGMPMTRRKNKATKKVSDFDMDKLRSTLKQFCRDWSESGRDERDSCYKPMLDALLDHFSDAPEDQRQNFRVLVPGAGLGRLAWDIAAAGFTCQGNEFSHFMLLSSYFILNKTDRINQHTIYPYIHSFTNMPSEASILRSVTIPDVLPSDLPENSDFSLVAGDFEEIYGISDEDALKDETKEPQEGRWHAVVTCFFIDTAKDVVNYLKVIHRILAPGGIWINLGPLLWHFENNTTGDPSIELTLEEVKLLSKNIGFEIYDERTIPTTYTGNNESMLKHEYQAAFWVGKKM